MELVAWYFINSPVTIFMIRVSTGELRRRHARIGKVMETKSLDAVYITNTTTFKYLADYFYIQSERPAALLMDRNLDLYFFGPEMEREHVLLQCPSIKGSYGYPDYPGKKHPLKFFGEWIQEISKGKRIGADNVNLYSNYWGFQGIPVKEVLPGYELTDVATDIYSMRKIKSEEEQALMRESSKWGNLAHGLLQRYTEAGKYDFEVAFRATAEASVAAMDAFGKDYRPAINYPVAVHAGFRGQVGEHSYYPHSLTVNREMRKGDILGSGASGNIDSYHIEIERNIFLGKPKSDAEKFHKLAVEMQEVAFNALKPGSKFSDVDRAVIEFAKDKDVLKYRLHHSGHNIGLEGHESPFIDIGDDSIIEPGMAFSLEPGIYVPKLGGFRHSDTVIMHEDGPEMITYYPSDTESLTTD